MCGSNYATSMTFKALSLFFFTPLDLGGARTKGDRCANINYTYKWVNWGYIQFFGISDGKMGLSGWNRGV